MDQLRNGTISIEMKEYMTVVLSEEPENTFQQSDKAAIDEAMTNQ